MKKLTISLFACLAAMMAQAQPSKSQPVNPSDAGNCYINPIVRADYPDPDVIRVGTTYYMVSTTMYHFPGATIIKSEDLVNWEYCAQPLKALLDDDRYNLRNGKNAYAKGMWASSMKYHNGKFWLLINGNDDRAWLLSATDPEGEWDVKRLSRNYYDPGMLFDGDKVYIACGYCNISMCELDADFNFIREKEIIVRERSGLEGCHVYKIGDYYYIYATYGGFPSGQAAFRSKSPFGPFEEKMLVEKHYDGKINTIHQGALFDDVEGKWWTVMQEDLGALGRFPNLLPVTWEDGWPIVAGGVRPPVSFVDKVPAPRTPSNQKTQSVLPTSDDFSGKELGMQWQWNHNPVEGAWSLTERPGWLRLKTTGITQELHQAQGMLTQRIFADPEQPSLGTVRVDVSKLKEGDRAGICIFQDPYAQICVERTSKKGYRLVWRQDKVRKAPSPDPSPEEEGRTFCTKSLPPRGKVWKGAIYLRAAIKYGDNKAYFFYSLDGKKWERFGGETQQSFNLSVFVGSRFGIFCYATKQEGGYADFDWFTTEP
jgi:beta-xylosidase